MLIRSHYIKHPFFLSWIICSWNEAQQITSLYANPYIVSKLNMKFHWNPLTGLGVDACTRLHHVKHPFVNYKLKYLPLESRVMNFLPLCKSSCFVSASCEVSLKSFNSSKGDWLKKICGQTNRQGDSYIPQNFCSPGV